MKEPPSCPFVLIDVGARVLARATTNSRVPLCLYVWMDSFSFLVNSRYGQIPRVLIAVATRWMPTM